MQVNHWQEQAEELFHEALQLKAPDRVAFLARACSGDESLRREVESLISALERQPNFIAESPVNIVMQMLSHDADGALVGKVLGHYKILQLLGRGGMGSVYLAEDCKLERQVALKFIAHSLIDNEWAKAQLTKEARATAKLEDHNICAVHDIEEIEGYHFIVMQYVEGQTLDLAIRGEPFQLGRVLDVAEQVVSALSAAHARAIIHHDIKPQNIIITTGGQVKVLDFGLAKFSRQQSQLMDGLSGDEQSKIELPGVVAGTIAYMSPEQARGEELDTRSDIFSFGIVLYEMLYGRNPFKRKGGEDTLDAIKVDDPPFARLTPGVPRKLHGVVQRCLAKKREHRYQTAAELLSDLRKLRNSHRLRRYALPALALFLLLVASAGFVYRKYTQTYVLVVLPVVNESGDPDVEYWRSGLTTSLADKLSRLPRLGIRAPTVSDSIEPVRAGRELQAEAVLLNKVVRQDGALQLQSTLVMVADGLPVWQETVPVNLATIQTLQDDIALKTTAGLNLWLTRDEKRLLTKHQTDEPAALSLYMKGQYYWNRRDKENIRLAIEMFTQATALDPSYAEAWAGLADSYVFLPTVAYGPEPTAEVYYKAMAAAIKALQRDPLLCEAHTSIGVIKSRYEWDWKGAEKEFQMAIGLNNEYAPAHLGYSRLLRTLKRDDEAIRESETFKRLEPFAPSATVNLAISYYHVFQYDKAAEYLEQVLREDSKNQSALYIMGLVRVKQGRYPEAIKNLEQLYALNPVFAAAPLGYAYARTGRYSDAFAILAMLEQVPPDKPVPAQEKAIIYMGLKDYDKTFAYLEEAYRERFPSLTAVPTDPFFDELHSDPRFSDLARRMGLTP